MTHASIHHKPSATAKTMTGPRRVSASAAARRASDNQTSPRERTTAQGTQVPGGTAGILSTVPPARPQISVVLPCLDEEAAVGEVVDQAWEGIEQTGLPGEVIVVNNGST